MFFRRRKHPTGEPVDGSGNAEASAGGQASDQAAGGPGAGPLTAPAAEQQQQQQPGPSGHDTATAAADPQSLQQQQQQQPVSPSELPPEPLETSAAAAAAAALASPSKVVLVRDEEDDYYYGSERRRPLWRTAEGFVAGWILVAVISAIAANIGVGGAAGRGRARTSLSDLHAAWAPCMPGTAYYQLLISRCSARLQPVPPSGGVNHVRPVAAAAAAAAAAESAATEPAAAEPAAAKPATHCASSSGAGTCPCASARGGTAVACKQPAAQPPRLDLLCRSWGHGGGGISKRRRRTVLRLRRFHLSGAQAGRKGASRGHAPASMPQPQPCPPRAAAPSCPPAVRPVLQWNVWSQGSNPNEIPVTAIGAVCNSGKALGVSSPGRGLGGSLRAAPSAVPPPPPAAAASCSRPPLPPAAAARCRCPPQPHITPFPIQSNENSALCQTTSSSGSNQQVGPPCRRQAGAARAGRSGGWAPPPPRAPPPPTHPATPSVSPPVRPTGASVSICLAALPPQVVQPLGWVDICVEYSTYIDMVAGVGGSTQQPTRTCMLCPSGKVASGYQVLREGASFFFFLSGRERGQCMSSGGLWWGLACGGGSWLGAGAPARVRLGRVASRRAAAAGVK